MVSTENPSSCNAVITNPMSETGLYRYIHISQPLDNTQHIVKSTKINERKLLPTYWNWSLLYQNTVQSYLCV